MRLCTIRSRGANRQLYLEALRRMTPEQRLLKACELSDMTKELLRIGIRRRHPDYSEAQIHALFLQQLGRCHNPNW